MAKLIEITGKPFSGEWGMDDETGNGIPVLRTTNFTNKGVVDYSDVVTRCIGKKNIEAKYLQYGDIILEKSGGSDKQPVGRVVFFEGTEHKYLFNNFTGLLRIKEKNKWVPKFVFYSLFASYLRGETRNFENKTTGLHNLKIDLYMSNIRVNDLPYSKQIDIVKRIDKINLLIELREKQLEKLDLLVKSQFIEMFGDFVLNPFNWEKEKLGNLLVVQPQNGMYKPQSEYVDDGGHPILRIDGFYYGKVESFSALKRLRCSKNDLDKYGLHNNDIVINRVNSIEYLGKSAVIDGLIEPTVFESNMMRMHPDEHIINSRFLVIQLLSKFVYNQILGHAKKAVNQASINQKDV